MTQTYNELLFESAAAEAEFVQLTSGMNPADVERFRSVLGKPSQFVGRVMSFAAAQEHWRLWAVWEAEQAELAAQAKKNEPKRARTSDIRNATAIEAASAEWHKAVADAKEAGERWDEYVRVSIAALRKQAEDAKAQWAAHVAEKREALRRARG